MLQIHLSESPCICVACRIWPRSVGEFNGITESEHKPTLHDTSLSSLTIYDELTFFVVHCTRNEKKKIHYTILAAYSASYFFLQFSVYIYTLCFFHRVDRYNSLYGRYEEGGQLLSDFCFAEIRRFY